MTGYQVRAWWAGREFPDPEPASLSDPEIEREIVAKLDDGWELAEILTVVYPPSWWARDRESTA